MSGVSRSSDIIEANRPEMLQLIDRSATVEHVCTGFPPAISMCAST